MNSKICHTRSGISADRALRLARYFDTAAEFWPGIQSHYDTEIVKIELAIRFKQQVKMLKRTD
jgi:addiction module HigA family antidote